jgi:hypothetical protein
MNLIIEPSQSKFLTHFQIMMRVGSLSDPGENSGLAHFTARALLRGTRTKSFQELSLAIEILGGSISVNVDQSETMFRASVLTKNIEPFLDLIRELLTEPRFEHSSRVRFFRRFIKARGLRVRRRERLRDWKKLGSKTWKSFSNAITRGPISFLV